DGPGSTRHPSARHPSRRLDTGVPSLHPPRMMYRERTFWFRFCFQPRAAWPGTMPEDCST
ncbi:MAG: hypothetical protein PVJ04_00845, partial [Gemmatimonadota bacterium]